MVTPVARIMANRPPPRGGASVYVTVQENSCHHIVISAFSCAPTFTPLGAGAFHAPCGHRLADQEHDAPRIAEDGNVGWEFDNRRMTDDALAHYTDLLARRSDLSEGLCWTVVEPVDAPLTVAEVVRRLGGDPAEVAPRHWQDAFGPYDPRPFVQLTSVGAAVMVVEPNGFQCCMPDVIERLSLGARVHCAQWDAQALSTLACAAFGHLLVRMEGLFPDQRVGLDVGALDGELGPVYQALGSATMPFTPALMAVVEARTGVRLHDAWFDSARPTVLLPPYHYHPEDRPHGCFFDPELEAAIRLASPEAHDALVAELLDLLADTGLLDGEPELTDARAALAAGVPRGDDRYLPLRDLANRLTGRFEAAAGLVPPPQAPAWRRARAAAAVHHALLPPSHTPAPIHAVLDARLALGDDWLAARSRLRRHLRPTGS